jgi:hypothetical protein
MPEGVNIEVAQQLNEQAMDTEDIEETPAREFLEIMEALLLALVSIATAWSGYQAARWDGHSALYYGESSKLRAQSSKYATLGTQTRLFDTVTFGSWLQFEAEGKARIAQLFERRFTPAYKRAFDDWLLLNPLLNPQAPPGPAFMPEYHNPLLDRSNALDAQATATFQRGTDARETADSYVRDTLILASVLFLIAIGQRFKVRQVRRTLITVSAFLLVFGIFELTTLPVV